MSSKMSIETLQKRLVLKDTIIPGLGPSIVGAAERFKTLTELALVDEREAGADSEASDGSALRKRNMHSECDVVTRDLRLHKDDVFRGRLAVYVCEQEMAAYDDLNREIDDKIEAVRKGIQNYQVELSRQQVIRQRKEQYEELSRAVNRLPPRKVASKQLKVLQEKLEGLQCDLKLMDEQIQSKTCEMVLLFSAINNLQVTYNEDAAVANALEDDVEELVEEGEEATG